MVRICAFVFDILRNGRLGIFIIEIGAMELAGLGTLARYHVCEFRQWVIPVIPKGQVDI
jgi:hypothetical protein